MPTTRRARHGGALASWSGPIDQADRPESDVGRRYIMERYPLRGRCYSARYPRAQFVAGRVVERHGFALRRPDGLVFEDREAQLSATSLCCAGALLARSAARSKSSSVVAAVIVSSTIASFRRTNRVVMTYFQRSVRRPRRRKRRGMALLDGSRRDTCPRGVDVGRRSALGGRKRSRPSPCTGSESRAHRGPSAEGRRCGRATRRAVPPARFGARMMSGMCAVGS